MSQARRRAEASSAVLRSRRSSRIGRGSVTVVGTVRPKRSAKPPRADEDGIDRAIDRAASRVVEVRCTDQATAQFVPQFTDREGSRGPKPLLGAIHPGPVPVPDLEVAVAGTHEQHVGLAGVLGVDERHGIGFVEAGEEEEGRVLAELVVDIVVAHGLHRSGDNSDAVPDGGGELGTAGSESIHVGEVRGRGRTGG